MHMAAIPIERHAATAAIGDDVAAVADALLDSSVVVRSGRGSGSGVIWGTDGLVVTNSHVVHGEHATVVLRGGDEIEGRLLARGENYDLAALQIAASSWPAATPGDADRVRAGQLVLAVGHPLGLRN